MIIVHCIFTETYQNDEKRKWISLFAQNVFTLNQYPNWDWLYLEEELFEVSCKQGFTSTSLKHAEHMITDLRCSDIIFMDNYL